MRYNRRHIIIFIIGIFLITATLVQAQTAVDNAFNQNLNQVSDVSGYEKVDDPNSAMPLYIGGVIAWTSFLGVIMLIQILLGGYEYMTAHDNAEKVLAAKKRIRNAVYAALILVSGYILVAAAIGVAKLATNFQG